MHQTIELICGAVWFVLPAYVANMTPVVTGGGRPLNGGKKFVDGRPLFGPGKTVRGFLTGVSAGVLVGVIQALADPLVRPVFPIFFSGRLEIILGSLLISSGAMVGDLSGSFIKRRLGLRRGSPFPVLDQLDFVVGALVFSRALASFDTGVVIVLMVLTPLLHLGTNYVGYKLGFKDRPY